MNYICSTGARDTQVLHLLCEQNKENPQNSNLCPLQKNTLLFPENQLEAAAQGKKNQTVGILNSLAEAFPMPESTDCPSL